jgi:6-pyruvoyltetrahydropterin/6-carboxytetrahydropterin synthase
MILRDTKVFKFDSAHRLPFHKGKCANMHGHTYTLEVTIQGRIVKESVDDEERGMITDFSNLKDIVNRVIIDKYDHACLNNIFTNPTSEIMAMSIFKELDDEFESLDVLYELYSVKLWEKADSSCSEVIRG